MKKFIIKTAFVIAFPILSIAQPVVQNAEKYKIGETYFFQICDLNNVDTTLIGPNQIWDYSMVSNLADTFIMNIVDPKTTPFHSTFPNATIVEEANNGTYVYAVQNDSLSRLEGFVDVGNSLEIEYPKYQLFMKRPLKFGDLHKDTYLNKYKAGGYDFSGGGNTTIEVDAYGTLKLPGRTYTDITRVTLTQDQLDTITQFGTETRSKSVSHLWFSENNPAPLFRVVTYSSSQGTTVSSSFLIDSTATTSVRNEAEHSQTILYPNPASNEVYIEGIETMDILNLSIVNLKGQLLITTSEVGRINTSNLPNGIYHVHINKMDGGFENHKLVINH